MKTSDAIHRRIGEYAALIMVAAITSRDAVRVLLESCLADNVAFLETMRRLMLEPLHPEPVAA